MKYVNVILFGKKHDKFWLNSEFSDEITLNYPGGF